MKVWVIRKKDINREKAMEILKVIYFRETGKKFNECKIKHGKYGKPYYDDEFYFNITHSKNYLGIVISKTEVGIDIEEPRKLYNNFQNKILSKEEQIINNDVLNNWVIKEAYSKFLGLGLNISFDKIDAGKIFKKNKFYNLSTKDYFCYVVGLEKLQRVSIEYN